MTQEQQNPQETDRRQLVLAAKARSPGEAAKLLAEYPASLTAEVLQELPPALTQDILAELPGGLVDGIVHAAPEQTVAQWRINQQFAQGSIGRMMEPVRAVFRPQMTVRDTVEQLRSLVRTAFITYGYIVDDGGRLLGIVTMRDLLFAADDAQLDSIMLRNAFCLNPELPLTDAMKLVLDRHYPVYPVCDAEGRLLLLEDPGQAAHRGHLLADVRRLAWGHVAPAAQRPPLGGLGRVERQQIGPEAAIAEPLGEVLPEFLDAAARRVRDEKDDRRHGHQFTEEHSRSAVCRYGSGLQVEGSP